MKNQLVISLLLFVLSFGLTFGLTFLASQIQALAQGEPFVKTFVGPFEVTAISDATGQMSFSLIKDISESQIEGQAQAVGATDGFSSFFNAFVVKTSDGVILIDTGNGPGENLVPKLEAAGIQPEEVTAILLTHFHGDHIGGLINKDGGAVFPKAIVYASTPEDQYWRGGNRGDAAKKALGPYKNSGRYTLFSYGEEILPGVTTLDLHGHTPGHTGFLFGSGPEALLFWGDIVHIAYVQFEYPEATMTYDVKRSEAAKTRAQIYSQAAESGYVVAGAHLPFPGLGQVAKSEGQSYTYKPYEK
jgi:glyoxylase-like metal-dependent hydrolase (beta-lactamase superfamily II)